MLTWTVKNTAFVDTVFEHSGPYIFYALNNNRIEAFIKLYYFVLNTFSKRKKISYTNIAS